MPSTSETGHAKNVANFATLHSCCVGYGAMYNPARDQIKITALQAMLNSANQILTECRQKKNTYDAFVDTRSDLFDRLRPVSTRVMNALKASGVSPTVIETGRTIQRKMQGKRATPVAPAPENGPAPKTSSVSQQSYDNLVANFSALIELVGSYPQYAPNEAPLQINGLTNYLEELRVANKNVMDAATDWSNARINRDGFFYAPGIGLVDIAKDVKNYVRSVFGPTSASYKQISALQFKRISENY